MPRARKEAPPANGGGEEVYDFDPEDPKAGPLAPESGASLEPVPDDKAFSAPTAPDAEPPASALVADLATLCNRDPKDLVALTAKAIAQLQSWMNAKPKRITHGDDEYLEFEDWQFLASFFGVTCDGEWSKPIHFPDDSGWEARSYAVVLSTGRRFGAAESMCLSSDPMGRNKVWGHKPAFQMRSMAQTRANAKVFRNVFGWLAKKAGYSPTPAEEMEEEREGARQKAVAVINEGQRRKLMAKARQAGVRPDEMKAYMKDTLGVDHTRQIPAERLDEVLQWIEGKGQEEDY